MERLLLLRVRLALVVGLVVMAVSGHASEQAMSMTAAQCADIAQEGLENYVRSRLEYPKSLGEAVKLRRSRYWDNEVMRRLEEEEVLRRCDYSTDGTSFTLRVREPGAQATTEVALTRIGQAPQEVERIREIRSGPSLVWAVAVEDGDTRRLCPIMLPPRDPRKELTTITAVHDCYAELLRSPTGKDPHRAEVPARLSDLSDALDAASRELTVPLRLTRVIADADCRLGSAIESPATDVEVLRGILLRQAAIWRLRAVDWIRWGFKRIPAAEMQAIRKRELCGLAALLAASFSEAELGEEPAPLGAILDQDSRRARDVIRRSVGSFAAEATTSGGLSRADLDAIVQTNSVTVAGNKVSSYEEIVARMRPDREESMHKWKTPPGRDKNAPMTLAQMRLGELQRAADRYMISYGTSPPNLQEIARRVSSRAPDIDKDPLSPNGESFLYWSNGRDYCIESIGAFGPLGKTSLRRNASFVVSPDLVSRGSEYLRSLESTEEELRLRGEREVGDLLRFLSSELTSYKLEHGRYPQTLAELEQDKRSEKMIYQHPAMQRLKESLRATGHYLRPPGLDFTYVCRSSGKTYLLGFRNRDSTATRPLTTYPVLNNRWSPDGSPVVRPGREAEVVVDSVLKEPVD